MIFIAVTWCKWRLEGKICLWICSELYMPCSKTSAFQCYYTVSWASTVTTQHLETNALHAAKAWDSGWATEGGKGGSNRSGDAFKASAVFLPHGSAQSGLSVWNLMQGTRSTR